MNYKVAGILVILITLFTLGILISLYAIAGDMGREFSALTEVCQAARSGA